MTRAIEVYEREKKIAEEKKMNNAFKRAFYQMEIDDIDIDDAECDKDIERYEKLIEEEWYYEETKPVS